MCAVKSLTSHMVTITTGGQMRCSAVRGSVSVPTLRSITAARLGAWTKDFEHAVGLFRKLVDAFYVSEFSFAEFLKQHPQHQANLTDLLIGRAFSANSAAIFADLDPVLRALKDEAANANATTAG